jgi:hypothetical protein
MYKPSSKLAKSSYMQGFKSSPLSRQTYKKMSANIMPKVSRGSDPIVSQTSLGRVRSDKKFNIYRGVSKSLVGKSKIIPSPIRKGGLKGALVTGAVSMLNVAIMKGAMNPGRFEVYGRMMQNLAVGKNMLNNTRLGLASGTSRINDMGHTMGLSLALSKSRHGRY